MTDIKEAHERAILAMVNAIETPILDSGEGSKLANAYLASMEAQGYVMAPVEATEEMRSEGESAASFWIGKPSDDAAIEKVWGAMLVARPRITDEPSPEKEDT